MKILDVVGARPQFIKVSPILQAIKRANERTKEETSFKIEEYLLHTGQHYDREMSSVFFAQLGLKKPNHNLGVGSGSHGHQTAEMIKGTEKVIEKEKPDLVVVYGDTNSTLAASLAASKLQYPIAHIEAGLRCYNRMMPEEINRVVVDHISTLLFCPTQMAKQNLAKENIYEEVHCVGDVMYDAALQNLKIAERKSKVLANYHLESRNYILATIHRQSNTDTKQRLQNIFKGLQCVAKRKLPVVLPLHPRTKKQIDQFGIAPDEISIIPPVSYLDMLMLENNAKLIITDSGGVQKEAFSFRVPCITVRDETEWMETVESGWNRLIKPNLNSIVQAVEDASPGRDDVSYYGEGRSADTIVDIILNWFSKR